MYHDVIEAGSLVDKQSILVTYFLYSNFHTVNVFLAKTNFLTLEKIYIFWVWDEQQIYAIIFDGLHGETTRNAFTIFFTLNFI